MGLNGLFYGCVCDFGFVGYGSVGFDVAGVGVVRLRVWFAVICTLWLLRCVFCGLWPWVLV